MPTRISLTPAAALRVIAVARTLPAGRLEAEAPGRLAALAFPAFLAALVGYGGFFAYAMLSNFDLVNLHRDTFIDDAFYYFEIARNLAAGKFSTFDGGITRTNGYHPVWLLLVTPFYWFFDLDSALFGIKALEIMLIAGGVCLLVVAVRLARLPWILLLAVLPALYVQRGMLFGTEAAAGAFFLGAMMLAAVLFARDPARWRWLLAGIAFLLPWVRLEYMAIALFATGGLALLPLGAMARSAWRCHFTAGRLWVAGLPFVGAVAGVVAYFLYNGVVFGGILPVSAVTKLAWSDNWDASDAADRKGELETFFSAAGGEAAAVAELCGYVLIVWAVGRLRGWNSDAAGLLAVLVTMLALGVEHLAVKVQIVWFYSARIEAYTDWYYVPGYMVAALMVPVRCFVVVFLLRRLLPDCRASGRRLAVFGVCVAGLVVVFDPYKFNEPFRFVMERHHSLYIMEAPNLAHAAVAFEPMLPRDAVIGSWDAGAIGYFAERPVVNLDGLVNSYAYLRATSRSDTWSLWLQRGGIPAFGVTHLVNGVLPGSVADVQYAGRHAALRTLRFSLKLWPHRPGSLRAMSWRSITSPSFGVNGKRTGYRLLRHGRLVRLFVPDCVPDGLATNVPEMLVFTWQEGRVRRSVQRLWVRPHRTELGYCTTPVLLPHGAEMAERIFVDATTVDRVVAGTPPILRSGDGVSVYAVERRLIYVYEREANEPAARCLADDGELASHFFHVHPMARRDLPLARLQHGFESHDGRLIAMRRSAGGRCLADVGLPAIEIREVWTGESRAGALGWRGRIDGLALQPAALGDFLAAAERIVVAAQWAVFLHEAERKLLFVRQGDAAGADRSAGCGALPVFLHVHPKRVADLPDWRQQHGFANRDFDFGKEGFAFAGRCFAAVYLPEYDVRQLIMGSPGGSPHTWHAPCGRCRGSSRQLSG